MLNRNHSGLFHWRVAPLVNPDGLLRERSQRMNDNGVDLNRNFPSPNWQEETRDYWIRRTSRNPRRYPGPGPLSEPESQWLGGGDRALRAGRHRLGPRSAQRRRLRRPPGGAAAARLAASDPAGYLPRLTRPVGRNPQGAAGRHHRAGERRHHAAGGGAEKDVDRPGGLAAHPHPPLDSGSAA